MRLGVDFLKRTERTKAILAVLLALGFVGMCVNALPADDEEDCPVADCMVVTGERVTCEDGWICSDGLPFVDSLDCYLFLTAKRDALITSGYGAPRPSGPHDGIDLGVPSGTAVYAAKDGVIAGVAFGLPNGDRSTANGNYVRINYDDGTQGVFLHLERVLVSVRTVGTSVDAGDQIGTSNDTGSSSGPHLHYTQYTDRTRSKTVDPTHEHPICG